MSLENGAKNILTSASSSVLRLFGVAVLRPEIAVPLAFLAGAFTGPAAEAPAVGAVADFRRMSQWSEIARGVRKGRSSCSNLTAILEVARTCLRIWKTILYCVKSELSSTAQDECNGYLRSPHLTTHQSSYFQPSLRYCLLLVIVCGYGDIGKDEPCVCRGVYHAVG